MNLKDINLNHIAIIMDGNGRWATNQGLERTAGHAAGEFSFHVQLIGHLKTICNGLRFMLFQLKIGQGLKMKLIF